MNAVANDLVQFLARTGGVCPIVRFYYDASSRLEYVGWAARGTATSAASWQVLRYSYTGASVQPDVIQSSLPDQILDDRGSISYA